MFEPTGTVLIGPVAPARVPLPPRGRDGLILPRLQTPRQPRVKSLGPEAITWVNGSGLLGRWQLLTHQRFILTRKLELDADGRLRWAVTVVTMARQQGKSVCLRCSAWWRLHQGERFGEEQTVVHVANLSKLAREVWRPAALHSMRRYGPKSAKWGKGAEEIDLSGHDHGRWVLQAADENAGIGWGIGEAHVDEGWNIDRSVVDDGLTPATAEREQPQVCLWSTAGDSSSDLMIHYRQAALADVDGTGSVLLLEWSPPEELPWDHPHTWRWSHPNWSDRREAFLQKKINANIGEVKFSTQYLNRWVKSINGWMPATVWAQSYSTDEPPPDRPAVMAVEVAPEGERLAWVIVWRAGEHRVIVRAGSSLSDTDLWKAVHAADPRILQLPPALAIHHRPERRRTMTVGVTELGRHLVGVSRAIRAGQVLHHPGDHVLTDDVLRSVAVTTDTGVRLSQAKSTGPIEATRALVWAVGETLKPSSPKPKARAA